MEVDKLTKVLAQLADHEARLSRLENETVQVASFERTASNKQRTLREIVKGKKFNNGQEQIAAIVGYHEKILNKLIHKDKIKEEWVDAKMTNKFSAEFISRAKGALIRVLADSTCDLTQTGEDFFDRLINNEPAGTTSK